MHKPQIAIIGGGCAGLSAAASLVDQGYAVTLFEASTALGGRARTVAVKRNTRLHLLDNGQHILIGAYSATLALLDKIGVDEKQVLLRLPLQMVTRNCQQKTVFSFKSLAYLPTPFDLLFALLSCQGLRFADRLAAIKLMTYLKIRRYQIDHDCPLADFLLLHKQSTHLISLLWEPLCLAALNTPIAIASTQIFLNALRDSFAKQKTSKGKKNSDFLLPKTDLSSILAQPLSSYISAKGAEIKLNNRVTSIQLADHGFSLESQDGLSFFSHVIIATPPANLAKLIAACPQLHQLATVTHGYQYQPIYTIYLQYADNLKLANVMTGLSGTLTQWVFDKGQLCQQHGLIAVVISGTGYHQTLSHEALALQVAEELRLAFPDLSEPLWHQVIAEKRATFSCTIDLARPAHKTQQNNLYLAGDYSHGTYPATIEGAVRSGIACANLIIQSDN